MNPIATQQAALDNTLIPAEVPAIYMHQFWNTIKKIEKTNAYNFKLDKKKCRVDTEVFRKILQICQRLPNQDFVELPSEDDLLLFIKELGYSGNCEMLSTIRLDRLRESRAQILWAMYNQMNVDYVSFLWEDFIYQADNREISLERKEHIPYPQFTKVIINHFISKDNTISMRNRINLHTVRDDTLLVPPKKARKFKKPASPKLKIVPVSPKEPTQKDTSDKSVSKKKAPSKADRGKGIELLFDAALLEDAQLKKTMRKSKLMMILGGDSEDVHDEDDGNDDDNGNDDDSGNDDDGGNDAQDSEQTDSDDDKNPSFTLKDYEEEEQDEEYESFFLHLFLII
uniref:Uncharacterized protein n=1 Tax=Tanacetum cinerariifolium TaxID=118510 RepID=A0A6L2MWN3_TANCI|nr:hypothetical protein [Tanacetum cinerariifolium]